MASNAIHNQNRFMCIGHSHVRRMHEFLERKETEQEGSLNFKISREQLSTCFLGFGGIRSEHLLVSSSRRNRTGKPLTKHEKAPRIIENAAASLHLQN